MTHSSSEFLLRISKDVACGPVIFAALLMGFTIMDLSAWMNGSMQAVQTLIRLLQISKRAVQLGSTLFAISSAQFDGITQNPFRSNFNVLRCPKV